MPGYLPKYPQTNLEKIETDEQLTVGKHRNILEIWLDVDQF